MDVFTTKQKVDNSKDISHDGTSTNTIDQIARSQNACPMLLTALFGFTKLGLSYCYKLSDCSHKLTALSFHEWTVQGHKIVKRTCLPNYKGARIEVNTSFNLESTLRFPSQCLL